MNASPRHPTDRGLNAFGATLLAALIVVRVLWLALRTGVALAVFLLAHGLCLGLYVGSGFLAGVSFLTGLCLSIVFPKPGLGAVGAFLGLYATLAVLAGLLCVAAWLLSAFALALFVVLGGMWLDDPAMVVDGLSRFAWTLFCAALFLHFLTEARRPRETIFRWARSRLTPAGEARKAADDLLRRRFVR